MNENIIIDRVGIKKIYVYDLNEFQLAQLKRSGSGSVYRDIGIALFSISVTLLITLFTAEFSQPLYERVSIDITIVFLVASIVLFLLAYRDQKNRKNIIKEIEKAIEERKAKDKNKNQ